jgi:DeoR family transcriptional regulator of aga operon
MFVGCNGVHPEHGVTNINLPEAEMKHRMLRAAQRSVVVADGSKIGQVSTAWVCDLDTIDLLITSHLAGDEEIGALKEQGLETFVV